MEKKNAYLKSIYDLTRCFVEDYGLATFQSGKR